MVRQPFAFRGVIASLAKPLEAFFLLVPIGSVSAQDIDVAITRLLRDGGISPDVIFVVYFSTDENALLESLRSEHIKERFEQTRRCRSLAAVKICKSSDFASPQTIHGDPDLLNSFTSKELFDTYRIAGMRFLSLRVGVVIRAAPGSYFLNPSGKKRHFFIRSGLLCRNSIEATYVASLLLGPLREAALELGNTPNILFVDTIGIAHFAYSLVDLAMALQLFEVRPDIRTFGSYGGLKEIRLGIGDYPMFLISASTSGNLASELDKTVKTSQPSRIMTTILGAYQDSYPSLVHRLDSEYSVSGVDGESYFDTLREIRVHGEDFLFTPGQPHAVELKRPQLPKNFAKQFANIQGKEVVHHFKKANSRKQVKPFLLHDETLVNMPNFQLWLKDQAVSKVPVTVRRVVYQEDKASKKMAETFVGYLRERWNGIVPVVTSLQELESAAPAPDEAVVVVAAVAGSGMELMRVCRELRRYQPHGARIFMIGALVAQSYRQLQQVISNLRLSEKPNQYSLEVWCEFSPTRVAIEQMRERELKLWKSVVDSEQTPADNILDFVRARIFLLEDVGMPLAGRPSTFPFLARNVNSPDWHIGKSFALWDSGFKNGACAVDVLFTVACWLQNARESGELKVVDRLSDGGFQQVVIAPDCFLRFTDPVIQASILRAGQDSEFNYTTSIEFSARATEIIMKFIELREVVALEFLFALLVGRLRLEPKHLRRLLDAAVVNADELETLLIDLTRKKYLEG
jgi:hypothetical protein